MSILNYTVKTLADRFVGCNHVKMAIGVMNIKQIIKLSPYPVKIEYIGYYDGFFEWANAGDDRPYQNKDFQPHIKVDKALSGARQLAVLIHELGHAIHYKKHCRCYTKYDGYNRHLAELHAYQYALQFMIKHKLLDALQYEYDHIIRLEKHQEVLYRNVSKKIQTKRIWKKAKKILDNR